MPSYVCMYKPFTLTHRSHIKGELSTMAKGSRTESARAHTNAHVLITCVYAYVLFTRISMRSHVPTCINMR